MTTQWHAGFKGMRRPVNEQASAVLRIFFAFWLVHRMSQGCPRASFKHYYAYVYALHLKTSRFIDVYSKNSWTDFLMQFEVLLPTWFVSCSEVSLKGCRVDVSAMPGPCQHYPKAYSFAFNPQSWESFSPDLRFKAKHETNRKNKNKKT